MESCPSPVYLIYSHECFVCISERVPRICLELGEARNRHWAGWTGVRDGRELPMWVLAAEPRPSSAATTNSSATEPPLQLFSCGLGLEATATFVE